MSAGVYVTGTDTGIGKTHASVRLLHALQLRGLRASGMKPVASGCRATPPGLRNEDAEALIAASSPAPAYADCNPYALAEPIAPHIAARRNHAEILLEPLCEAYRRIARGTDRVVVEGVGGWLAPLSDSLMQADLVRALQLPVVLVVGLRLGCINHALLSARTTPNLVGLDIFSERGCTVITHTDDEPSVAQVTDHLIGLDERHPFDAFYVCGSNRLARAVHALAERRGVPAEIAMEQHMACGFGDCHGCVIDVNLDREGNETAFREVCHYGPVFDTWEVVHARA